MNRLNSELRRLYFANDPEHAGTDPTPTGLIARDGRVRALVLGLARPADWTALSAVWQGVQADLELPAPAIAVSGTDAIQLWFSLSQPVTLETAQDFLRLLRLRYLGQIAPARVQTMPQTDPAAPDTVQHARVVPACQETTGNWSAFVSSDLAAVFAEEPWLDLSPGPEAQADLLSRLASIPAADFELALSRLDSTAPTDTPPLFTTPLRATATHTVPASESLHPRRFLLAVMSDPGAAMALRIEAAKALLPYFDA